MDEVPNKDEEAIEMDLLLEDGKPQDMTETQIEYVKEFESTKNTSHKEGL